MELYYIKKKYLLKFITKKMYCLVKIYKEIDNKYLKVYIPPFLAEFVGSIVTGREEMMRRLQLCMTSFTSGKEREKYNKRI